MDENNWHVSDLIPCSCWLPTGEVRSFFFFVCSFVRYCVGKTLILLVLDIEDMCNKCSRKHAQEQLSLVEQHNAMLRLNYKT